MSLETLATSNLGSLRCYLIFNTCLIYYISVLMSIKETDRNVIKDEL